MQLTPEIAINPLQHSAIIGGIYLTSAELKAIADLIDSQTTYRLHPEHVFIYKTHAQGKTEQAPITIKLGQRIDPGMLKR